MLRENPDGKLIKTIDSNVNDSINTQKIVISSFTSDSQSDTEELIFAFTTSGDVYYLNCVKSGTWIKAEFILSENATALYGSAFDG